MSGRVFQNIVLQFKDAVDTEIARAGRIPPADGSRGGTASAVDKMPNEICGRLNTCPNILYAFHKKEKVFCGKKKK